MGNALFEPGYFSPGLLSFSVTYLKLEVLALYLRFGHVKFPKPGNAGTGPNPTVFPAKAGRFELSSSKDADPNSQFSIALSFF
jgi:hypothetical protein